MEIVEIAVCVFAVYGAACILSQIRQILLYPMKIRRLVRACVETTDVSEMALVLQYARFLQTERKISSNRLIILMKDDIMIKEKPADLHCGPFEYLICKEFHDTENRNDQREGS